MKNYARTENSNKNGFTHYYTGVSSSDLSESVHDWFISQGYKLKDGDGGNGNGQRASSFAYTVVTLYSLLLGVILVLLVILMATNPGKITRKKVKKTKVTKRTKTA